MDWSDKVTHVRSKASKHKVVNHGEWLIASYAMYYCKLHNAHTIQHTHNALGRSKPKLEQPLSVSSLLFDV